MSWRNPIPRNAAMVFSESFIGIVAAWPRASPRGGAAPSYVVLDVDPPRSRPSFRARRICDLRRTRLANSRIGADFGPYVAKGACADAEIARQNARKMSRFDSLDRGSGGGSLVVREMKAAMEHSFPPAPTSTPSASMKTSPLRRNSRRQPPDLWSGSLRPVPVRVSRFPLRHHASAGDKRRTCLLVPSLCQRTRPLTQNLATQSRPALSRRRPKSVDDVQSEIKEGRENTRRDSDPTRKTACRRGMRPAQMIQFRTSL